MSTNRELQRDLRDGEDRLEHARHLYLQSGDATYLAEHRAALTRVHRLRAALGLPDLSGEMVELHDDDLVSPAP